MMKLVAEKFPKTGTKGDEDVKYHLSVEFGEDDR